MVDVKTLSPGDTVKIVGEWCSGCHQNNDGEMDHWLGKMMTVREVVDDGDSYGMYVEMEEDINEYDGDGWDWFPAAIECVISCAADNDNEFYIDDAELMSVLGFAGKDIFV